MNGRPLFLAAAIVATACATASQSGETTSRMDLISEADIAELSAATALDVVRRLRPAWLRVRTGGDEPVVYIDRTRRGGLELLSSLAIEVVQEMSYMSASEATIRFGTGHRGGAILVTTKR
ncbi:MAG: hypothetical protein OER90_12120 [Gemmatimonadota bacterium]|nr:hypothetical protein [Gemmatimonadota bacterium]